MQSNKITSRQNPGVKNILSLRDKSSERRSANAFIIEGYREIRRAYEAGAALISLYFCPSFFKNNAECVTLISKLESSGLSLIEVDEGVFEKISKRQGCDGLLAISEGSVRDFSEWFCSENAFILVIEGVEKPGNLGALLRTAEGVGVDAVILCDAKTDLYNPQVIRNSQGAVFNMPVYEASKEELFARLQEHQFSFIATTPDTSLSYVDASYSGNIAVFVGSEHSGLNSDTLAACTQKIMIPMAGISDSLNINVAAAVVLFEAARQRKL